MNRRGFLGSILAAGMAPAIVRADALMRVRPIIVPATFGGVIRTGLSARELRSAFGAREPFTITTRPISDYLVESVTISGLTPIWLNGTFRLISSTPGPEATPSS